MQKNDKSIYNIVEASINRHSMDIETWQKTKLWNEGNSKEKLFLTNICKFTDQEIPILYFYLNQENWTVFSTKAIYFQRLGNQEKVIVGDIETYDFDVTTFKTKGKTSVIEIVTKNGQRYKFLYETGKPSMGAIYATQTLIQIAYQ